MDTAEKPKKIQKYTITIETFENRTRMHRFNDGFNPIELLGICEFISCEVREQMKGVIQPDVVKRESVQHSD